MEHFDDDPLWDASLEEAAWAQRLDEPRSLVGADSTTLTYNGLLDQLIEIQQAQAKLAALEAKALVALAGQFDDRHEVTFVDDDGERERTIVIIDEAREEIAAALRRSPAAVHNQIVAARLLAGPLSETATALSDGRLTGAHAQVIADAAARLTGALTVLHDDPADDNPDAADERERFIAKCLRLQERALPLAERLTPGQLRSRLRRAVDSVDAIGQARRRQEARCHIGVEVQPEDNGLALLLARMPIEDAARIKAAIDASASQLSAGSARPIGELRVQSLLDAMCGSGEPVTVTAEIQVVIDLATLAGLGECAGTVSMGGRPPESLAAAAIRELLADPTCPATLRRLVTDPMTGHLLDRGRSSYQVSDAMRAFLVARHQTCRHPGCGRSARRSQIDHAVAWHNGGRTDRDNLGPLCLRHHQLKTHGGWDLVRSREDGTAEWLSPRGREYTVKPPPLVEPE